MLRGGQADGGALESGGAIRRWDDSDSDETVVEGSVTESDVEEEEFRRRRLLFLDKDVALATVVGINEGAPSPEISFIQKFFDQAFSQKEEQINPVDTEMVAQEACISDQSQSLLQGWINFPSLPENISKADFPLKAAVEGQQNNSVDTDLNGVQKDSEEKDIVTIEEEERAQDVFLDVLEDCQRTCMTFMDTDNRVKEHSPNNDTDLSLTSPGKIFVEAFTEQNIETGELEINVLLRSPNDSESLEVINPLPDKSECQGCASSIDPSAKESSDALPVQLVTPRSALSASVVQPVVPVVPNEKQFNTEGEQLNSEPGIPHLDGDCTQITDVIEPQLATIQVEEIDALKGSNLQRTTNEQPAVDQQREKEAIPDYCNASSSEKQTEGASSHSVEAAACAETAQTTSRSAMQFRETPSRKCGGRVSSHCPTLDETQQAIPHSGSTTRKEAKDSDKIQKSKDKQDLETNIWQDVTQNRKVDQRRRSKRIEDKCRQEALPRNSVNPVCPMSLSTVNRKDTYGRNDSKKMSNPQNVDDTNPHQISLQRDKPEPACADSTDVLQQTVVNEVQNLYTNMSEDRNSCTEHTLQANAGSLLAHELLAATNGESVSGSPYNSTSGVQSHTKCIEQNAPQPQKGKRILLNAEESVEGCHMETENAGSLEMKPVALQVPEKGTLQLTQERQMVENMLKETSQKTDEGVFAGVSGTEGIEKNGEEGNVKTNVLSQFTETEEVQAKRLRLRSTETSQKAASYSSSNKTRLSSNQSQPSQSSEQQTPKKLESSLSTRKEAVILHDTYNTRARRKMKTKRNEKGETRLHIAARRGDLSLVKTLISSGICVNEQDYAGWTAIHEASNMGFTEVILELLKAGADVNSRNVDGVLPIHDAVRGNYLEAVRILLQHGANPCERSDSGESALDAVCDDEMKELLQSYLATDSALPVETIEVTERKYPSRSGRSKHHCYNYCKNDDAALKPQHEKYSVESVAAMQDAEEKQKELMLLELRTSKDADVYIQRLPQMQSVLNEMLAKQKVERDTLAKKYRASAESFKKGALRKQLVHLASKQKRLLAIAQTQEKLVQKIQNYRKTKQVFSASCSEKQISHSVISCGNDEGRSLTADESMCPDVVTFSMDAGARVTNENGVEAHLSLENRFSAQECSQHPHICVDKTEANKEAIRSEEASDHALASESGVREYPFNNMSMLTNAVEVVTLPSEPAVSTAKTTCSQDVDCVAIAEEGIKSLNPTSVTNTLNTVEPQSAVVHNSVCQPGNDYQQVLTDEHLHRYVNKKEAFQQQVVLSASTKNFPNTLQQTISWSSKNSFNGNSVASDLASNTDYPGKLSEQPSQSYSNQECEQNQVRHGRRNRKKLQLIDLLELGRIKPGENVLEFKLQEFTHKATLLKNGKIRTSKRQIVENPVQWVKDLLGGDISVTWKYVWNKVTYLGTQLSEFLVEKMTVSSDLELPLQEREPLRKNFIMRDPNNHNHQSPGTVSIAQPRGSSDPSIVQPNPPSLPQTEFVKTLLCTGGEAAINKAFKSSSVQFNSMESLTHFLQFREIVTVRKEEFLPCSAMEKHWSFYKGCEDFGF